MIHMYWDVVIKTWDCLEDFVRQERKKKVSIDDSMANKTGATKGNPVCSEFESNRQIIDSAAINTGLARESEGMYCDKCRKGQRRSERRISRLGRFIMSPRRSIWWLFHRLRVGKYRKDLGYKFDIADFRPASCYPRSHYENFELLMRHCECFAWARGIRRPQVYSPPDSNASRAVESAP